MQGGLGKEWEEVDGSVEVGDGYPVAGANVRFTGGRAGRRIPDFDGATSRTIFHQGEEDEEIKIRPRTP